MGVYLLKSQSCPCWEKEMSLCMKTRSLYTCHTIISSLYRWYRWLFVYLLDNYLFSSQTIICVLVRQLIVCLVYNYMYIHQTIICLLARQLFVYVFTGSNPRQLLVRVVILGKFYYDFRETYFVPSCICCWRI